jgi:hypothetical protein
MMEVKSKKTVKKKNVELPTGILKKTSIAKQIQELSGKINNNITKKWFETTVLVK